MDSPKHQRLSHVSESGEAKMVDVSAKPKTERLAVANSRVSTTGEVVAAVFNGCLPKGESLSVARVAGIMAAKRTADLIPLCHQVPLDWVDIAFEPDGDQAVSITATAKTVASTGVEMEALVAATVAALTIYDMVKALDKSARIGPIQLERKDGGKGGSYNRAAGK